MLLTRETHGANISDVDEVAVTEAGGAIIHMDFGRQTQLIPTPARLHQEYPLHMDNPQMCMAETNHTSVNVHLVMKTLNLPHR